MSDDPVDFVESLGPAFVPHLLRRISDAIVEAEKVWHEMQAVPSAPRTSSTLFALDRHGALSVTELATLLCQSHQLAQQWVRDLKARGLVAVQADPDDARRSLISLTPQGKTALAKLKSALAPIEDAILAWFEDFSPDLIDTLWQIERRVRGGAFLDAIRAAARRREDEAL